MRWQQALTNTCHLLHDVGGTPGWSDAPSLRPLDGEAVEQELNELFDAAFELCAYDTHAAQTSQRGGG